MDTSSLMEQILSKDNLNAAYLQVVRNKGAAGIDGMTVEELGAYLSKKRRKHQGTAADKEVQAAAGQKGGDTKARRWNKEPWSANGGRPLCTAGGSTGAHSDL